MKARPFFALAALALSMAAGPASAGDPLPSLSSPELAQGQYSAMHMLLEKTVLNVDVLTVDVKFGKAAREKLKALAAGKQYSEGLGKQVADVAIKTDDALVQLKFARDVSLDMWMDAVFENLEQARDAGLITPKIQERVKNALPTWFAALKERGYEKGDRVLYRVRPDSLRTVVVSANGKVLMDRLEKDKDVSRVVMSSYFAPKSDFRELLLKSLFKK